MGKPKFRPKGDEQSAKVQALALATGQDPEELAKRIPKDTLRRLKFPVVEQAETDGTTLFKEDKGIVQGGRRALLATDHTERRK